MMMITMMTILADEEEEGKEGEVCMKWVLPMTINKDGLRTMLRKRRWNRKRIVIIDAKA